MQTLNTELAAWVATGGATATADGQGWLSFNDGTRTGAHVLRLGDDRLQGAMVALRLVARPLPGCATQLLILHPGAGVAVCRVAPDGRIVDRGMAAELDVQRDAEGVLSVSATYFSSVPQAAIGTASGGTFYPGIGRPQFAFKSVSLAAAAPTAPGDEARIELVMVGSGAPIPPTFRRLMPRLRPTVLPWALADSAALEAEAAMLPGGRVVKAVLYNKKGRRKLNRAASAERSSLLAIDRRTLRKFAEPAPFEVLEQISVDCVRYDELHAAGSAPAPDVLRLEAQGTEYEVLQGFGSLLAGCLAIQVRTALYPVYKGQKLLGDVTALLDKFDLGLVGLAPLRQPGQMVEAQAWFLKSEEWAATQPQAVQDRLAAVRGVAGFGG